LRRRSVVFVTGRLRLALSLSLLALISASQQTLADSSHLDVLKERHTLKELRDLHVVKQDTDYSCGAAALATLMTYYFKDPTSEQEILRLLVTGLSEDESALKQLFGFSLLDLKRVAVRKGYRAAGFELTFEQLRQLTAPVIVFVTPRGYPHFAVLRDVIGDRVYLADPARGNLVLSIARFLSEWGRIVFVLGKAGEAGIVNYPLEVDLRQYDRWEPLDINRMMNIGARVRSFAVRAR
jgi:uncharacterized protein